MSNLLGKLEMSRRTEAAVYAAKLDQKREQKYPPEDWEKQ